MKNNDAEEKPVLNLPAKDLPIQPITLHEVEEEAKKRVSFIDKEFATGFAFIKNQEKSITFFGSARFPETNPYYQKARSIAGKLAGLGYTIVTGGGPGIMEGGNRGAFEAGGKSLGINIKLPYEQVANPYITEKAEFYYFFTRKVMMSFSAEAYIFFPGGFGTLDEFFEVLTLVQTNRIEKVPIILVGQEYWTALDVFIEEHMLKRNLAIDPEDRELYTITENEDEIMEIVKRTPIRNGIRVHFNQYPENGDAQPQK